MTHSDDKLFFLIDLFLNILFTISEQRRYITFFFSLRCTLLRLFYIIIPNRLLTYRKVYTPLFGVLFYRIEESSMWYTTTTKIFKSAKKRAAVVSRSPKKLKKSLSHTHNTHRVEPLGRHTIPLYLNQNSNCLGCTLFF